MSTQINHDRPYAIYDPDTKTLIGVFKYGWIVQKYLGTKHYSRITDCAIRKGRILKNKLGFPVSVRFANDDQIAILGDTEVFINDDSRARFDFRLLNNFHSTRFSLYVAHCERINNNRK